MARENSEAHNHNLDSRQSKTAGNSLSLVAPTKWKVVEAHLDRCHKGDEQACQNFHSLVKNIEPSKACSLDNMARCLEGAYGEDEL